MGLVLGNPLRNRVAVLILDDQLSAGQLFTCGNVNLGDMYPGNVIFHDYRGIVQQFPFLPGDDPELLFIFQIVDVCLVQFVAVSIRFALQTENNVISNGVPVCGPLLGQCVFFVKMQTRHTVRCIGGNPGVHNVVLRIFDDQRSTGQLFVVGQIPLAYPQLGRLVGAGAVQNLQNLAVVVEGDIHLCIVEIIAQRGAQLADKVIAAVGRGIQSVTLAVPLAADGNIAVEIGVAVRNSLGTGGNQITGREQLVAVHVVDVITGVQVEHGTGQIVTGLRIELVHTHAGMLTVIVETKGLLFSQFCRGFRCAYNIKMLLIISIFDDALCHDHIVQLIIPDKCHIVAVCRTDIPIGWLGFLYMVAAQRQGDADLAERAVVDDRQKIIGRLGAGRRKHSSVRTAVTGGNNRNHVTLGIPERAAAVGIRLAVLRVDVLGSRNGVFRTGQRAQRIGKVGVGLAGHPGVNQIVDFELSCQGIAGLTDSQLAQRFLIPVVLANDQRVHAVFIVVAGGLVDAVRGNIEIHIVVAAVGPLVIKSVRADSLHNAVFAQRQLFRQGQDTFLVGVEGVHVLGQMSIGGIRHRDQLGLAIFQPIIAVVIQPVDLESSVGQQNGLACVDILLCDFQIHFNFLIQYSKFLIGIRCFHHTVLRRSHSTPGVIVLLGVNTDQKRFCLEQVVRGGRLHDQIGAVGQPLHANVAGIIAEDFGQLILVVASCRLPAVTFAVLVVACRGQRFVVGGHFVGVDLVGLGNGLCLTGKIPLGVLVVVFLVDVGI